MPLPVKEQVFNNGAKIYPPPIGKIMTAIQLLEQLATNPTHKRNLVADSSKTPELTQRAQAEISDLMKEQRKIWCALLPAEDEEPNTNDEPGKDADDNAEDEKRSDN